MPVIRIAIVEDEEEYIGRLTEYVRRFGAETDRAVAARVFRDGEDIAYDMFSRKPERAAEHIRPADARYIVLNDRDGSVKLDAAQIRYVESAGHQMIYHTGSDGPLGFVYDQVGGYFIKWAASDSDEPTYNLIGDAVCKGGAKKGVMMEPKHFAFNHQEMNRSGVSTFDQVMGYLVFAALSGVAILLYLVTSFVNLEK